MTDAFAGLSYALKDRYLVEQELGRGGMALVYQVRDLRHDRLLAMKVLNPELAASIGAERFVQEIFTTANLHHPHILPVHDSGSDAGFLWYTMPLIRGESLRSRLARTGRLDLGSSLKILHDVSEALDYAHRHGVVHRDIKPENILLEEDQALVADFGIARAIGLAGQQHLTQTGLIVGTPAYMSPEQVAGGTLEGRSDQYSLACVTFELLTGRPLFTGATPQAVIFERFRVDHPRLDDLPSNLPASVSIALQRALSQEPHERFDTVGEFTQALAAPTAATLVSPRGSSASIPRVAVPAGALAAVILGAGVLWSKRAAIQPSSPESSLVAVLPFKHLGSPQEQYLTDGLTEEVASRLAAAPGLAVISRTSADQYRNSSKPLSIVGRELGVRYVLEGSARWATSMDGSKQLRVTPQLVDVSRDTSIWATQYNSRVTSIFEVQSNIAEQVAASLNVTLLDNERAQLARPPTKNAEAYDYYLRGKQYFGRGHAQEDVTKAVELFGRAVALDPAFALAYAGLSRSHDLMYWHYWDRTPERVKLAREAALTAVHLEPNLAEAHLALGYSYYHGQLDYPNALKEFAQASARRPNSSEALAAQAYVQRRLGLWSECIANLERALRTDPRSKVLREELGMTLVIMGDYPRAERYLDQAIALQSWVGPYALKINVAYLQGRPAEQSRLAREALAKHPFEELVNALGNYGLWGHYAIVTIPELQPMIRGTSAAKLGDTLGYYSLVSKLHSYNGERSSARTYLDSARIMLENLTKQDPAEADYRGGLALMLSELGRHGEAIRESRRASELLPLSKDTFGGMYYVAGLAAVYSRSGEIDAALQQIRRLVTSRSSVWIQVVERVPVFDQLRGSPQWNTFVEQLPSSRPLLTALGRDRPSLPQR